MTTCFKKVHLKLWSGIPPYKEVLKMTTCFKKVHLKPEKETEYKIWCDNCYTWASEFDIEKNHETPNWICCKACGNGLIMVE